MASTESINDLFHNFLNYQGYRYAEKSITFAGGTTNAIGDYDGTGNPFTIFTITGVVLVRLVAICTTTLEGASATLRVGTALANANLIASTTGTSIIINEIWHDTTPDSSAELTYVCALPTNNILFPFVVCQNIIGTVGTANITAGVIKFICYWVPISLDGNLVEA